MVIMIGRSRNSTFYSCFFYREASRTPLIDVFEHDYTGLDRDPEQRQEADPRGDAKVRVRDQKSKQTAERREHHVDQKQSRPFQRAEHRVQNDEDQQNSQRHNNGQARTGALCTFVLALPVDVISTRQLDLSIHLFHRFLNRAAEVPVADAIFHRNVSLIAFAVYLGSTVELFYLAKLRK
jgi:hypothetical protein